MDKFMNELKESDNPWIKRIGDYLLKRDDLQENLKKENKSLKECFDYILIEISKAYREKGNFVLAAGEDEEIFSLAVHYYDEDDIKIGKKNFITNADCSDHEKLAKKIEQQLQKENKKKEQSEQTVNQKTIDTAVAEALEKYKQELEAKERQKKEEEKKKKEELKAKKQAMKNNDYQLDLFSILGDEDV